MHTLPAGMVSGRLSRTGGSSRTCRSCAGRRTSCNRAVRQRKHGHDAGGGSGSVVDDDEEGTATAARLAMEVVRLKREQKANEELLAAMWRRVQEVERQPQQMLASFLASAAGDPQVLRRIQLDGTSGGGSDGVGGSRNSAETEDSSGPVKSARMLRDSGRGQLGSGSGDGDGAAGRRTHGVLGGGEDDFDYTGFLTGSDREGGALMPPCTFPADSGYWRLC